MSGEVPKGCCGDCANPVVFSIWAVLNLLPVLLMLIGVIMVEAAFEAAFTYFAGTSGVAIPATTGGLFIGLFMPAIIMGLLTVILGLIAIRMLAALSGPPRYEGPYRGMLIATLVFSILNMLYLLAPLVPLSAIYSAAFRFLCNLYQIYMVSGVDVGKLFCDLASAWEVLLAGTFMTIALHIAQQIVISCTPAWCDPGCADCCCACCACCQEKTTGGV